MFRYLMINVKVKKCRLLTDYIVYLLLKIFLCSSVKIRIFFLNEKKNNILFIAYQKQMHALTFIKLDYQSNLKNKLFRFTLKKK